MRRLIIYKGDNQYDMDIDDNTVIAVDIQFYNIKEPSKRKINITNTFTVPATINNLKIIGHPTNIHSMSNDVYECLYADYYIDNYCLMSNYRVRVDEIDSDRISLTLYEKPLIWEQFKEYKWSDFLKDYMKYLRYEIGLPVYCGDWNYPHIENTFSGLIATYAWSSNYLIIPYYMSNLAKQEYLENETNLYIEYDYNDNGVIKKAIGGHVCIFIKNIFEFLEYKFGINFHATGSGFVEYNAFDDPIIKGVYIPARDIKIIYNPIVTSGFCFALRIKGDYGEKFLPYDSAGDKEEKTIYDLIVAFFQYFNIIPEMSIVNGSVDIKLRRLDDIENINKIIDWSDRIEQGTLKYKPYIDGYAQKSYIKFKSLYKDLDTSTNAKEIICNNKNIDSTTDLFSIDAYIPAVSSNYPNYLMLDEENALKTWTFMISRYKTPYFVNVIWRESSGKINVGSQKMYVAQIVSLATEYKMIEKALSYPKYYEIERWITLKEIMDLDRYALYYIRDINAACLINKISGFNPQMSNAPTKIELIKINDNQPSVIEYANYYVDGFEEVFVDGDNYGFI